MGALTSEHELDRAVAECQAAGSRVFAAFEQMVAAGNSPRFAAMLALQSPPGAKNTDRTFCEGQRGRMDRMSKVNRRAVEKQLRQKGFDPGNRFHISGLGPPTDPKAWVTCADDVLAIAKARNLDVTGAINHSAVEHSQARKDVALAPDIANKISEEYMAADPGLKEKCRKSRKAREELKERVVATHGKGARKKR